MLLVPRRANSGPEWELENIAVLPNAVAGHRPRTLVGSAGAGPRAAGRADLLEVQPPIKRQFASTRPAVLRASRAAATITGILRKMQSFLCTHCRTSFDFSLAALATKPVSQCSNLANVRADASSLPAHPRCRRSSRQHCPDARTADRQGYDVLTACNAMDAEAIMHHTPPDLVLLDVIMPVKSGYELCREWKNSLRPA